jgi:hypothetical protein
LLIPRGQHREVIWAKVIADRVHAVEEGFKCGEGAAEEAKQLALFFISPQVVREGVRLRQHNRCTKGFAVEAHCHEAIGNRIPRTAEVIKHLRSRIRDGAHFEEGAVIPGTREVRRHLDPCGFERGLRG